MDKKALTAPCGLDCFNCELYERNLTADLSRIIHEKLGVPEEEIACKGCREQDGKHYHFTQGGCATLDCIKAKGVSLCTECADFPCALLAPLAQGAGMYPHNMKIYNLCRIRQVGLDRWIEEAADIRGRYFKMPFVVGKGQVD